MLDIITLEVTYNPDRCVYEFYTQIGNKANQNWLSLNGYLSNDTNRIRIEKTYHAEVRDLSVVFSFLTAYEQYFVERILKTKDNPIQPWNK